MQHKRSVTCTFALSSYALSWRSATNDYIPLQILPLWQDIDKGVCVLLSQISKYDDPQEAAIAVVVEAYRLWLQYEVRTDDITVIIARVEGLKEGAALTTKQSMRCSLRRLSWNSLPEMRGSLLGLPAQLHA